MLQEPSVLLFQRNGWPYNFPLHPSANLSCPTQLATTIKYIYRASKSWGSFQPDNWCNKTRHTDEDKKEWIPALSEWGPHCRLLGRIQLPLTTWRALTSSLSLFFLSHSLSLFVKIQTQQQTVYVEVRKARSAGRCLFG